VPRAVKRKKFLPTSATDRISLTERKCCLYYAGARVGFLLNRKLTFSCNKREVIWVCNSSIAAEGDEWFQLVMCPEVSFQRKITSCCRIESPKTSHSASPAHLSLDADVTTAAAKLILLKLTFCRVSISLLSLGLRLRNIWLLYSSEHIHPHSFFNISVGLRDLTHLLSMKCEYLETETTSNGAPW
jgi:hypothetical protein